MKQHAGDGRISGFDWQGEMIVTYIGKYPYTAKMLERRKKRLVKANSVARTVTQEDKP